MSIKLSHSSQGKWQTCGHSYKLHYIEGWRPVTFSSALVFGSAIDNSLNYMLENKDQKDVLQETLKVFDQNWEQGENSRREKVDMPLNPLIEYARFDFDPDLLEKSDWAELFKYDENFFDTKSEIDSKLYPKEDEDGNKASPVEWVDIPEEQRTVYNYAIWKCLARKGYILLTAYYNEILPNIKEVLAVQKTISLLDEEGNDLNGVVDIIVKLDGKKFGLAFDPVTIVDNKTTSTKYDEDSVYGSEQLAKYQAIMNIKADDPQDEWQHKIDMCAYAVMSKKLIKDITKRCSKCGHIGQGSHKTCDNIIEGTRCNGGWDKDKKFAAKTQFIVGKISEQFEQNVLENAGTVKACIENGLFPKNYSACSNMYGRACQFLHLCHKGDPKGLINVKK